MEINCDTVACVDDVSLVQNEPLPIFTIAKMEISSLDHNGIGAALSCENENVGEDITTPGVLDLGESFNRENAADAVDDDDDDEGTKYDPRTDREDVAAKRKRAHAISKKRENICVSTLKSKSDPNDVDHLISNYMDMSCEICQHPFDTLSDASLHYRQTHSKSKVKVKCCRRQMGLPNEIRDHIQYHLDPDKFK